MFSFSKKILKNGFIYTQKRNHNSILVQHLNSLPKHDALEELMETDYIQRIEFDSTAKPGLEPSLNWSLAPFHIHPQFDAFGNANITNILKNTYGKKDIKNQTLIVDAFPLPKFDKFILKSGEENTIEYEKETQNFSEVFAKRVLKEVGYHVSSVPESFVQDSNVGSSVSSSCNVRVITDNSVSSFFLRNLLFKMPKRRLPTSFKFSGAITHAAGYKFADPEITEEFYGPKPADLGLKIEEFIFTNEKTNNIIISAISDTKLLLESIVSIASKQLFKSETPSLMLESDSFITEKGEVVLFLNKENSKEKLFGEDLNTVYGGNHNVWSTEGLSRCWRSIITERTKNEKVEKEDFVEVVNSKLFRVTKPISGMKPNLVNHPKKIVFCVNDSKLKKLTKLTEKEALKHFGDSFTLKTSNFGSIPSKEQVEKFEVLLSTSKPEIYLLNISNSNENLSKSLNELKGL